MQHPPLAPEALVQQLSKIEASLDDVVNHGSDDELFVSSYLQGHFAVVARQVEMQPEADIDTLDGAMKDSLNAAFSQGELEADDQRLVWALWERLVTA